MSKIIKIRIANPKALRINYIMTTSCPYSCRYCPDTLNAGDHREINLTDLETFLLRFTNRNRAIQLTGGECTTHPQFKDIIEVSKRAGYNVSVDSNSVRTLRFYDEVKHLVDNWCITLHPSQHTLDLEKLKLLAAHSFLVVYVIMDPDYWNISLDWLEKVSQLKDLKVTPIRIMDNWSGANFEANYTQEQLDFLSKTSSRWLFTAERETELRKTHMWLADTESFATFEDGTTTSLDAFEIIRKKQNNFYGWRCEAGNESICIFDDGYTSWANCGIKKFKHYRDVYPKDLEESIICKFKECTCGTDIRSTKSQI